MEHVKKKLNQAYLSENMIALILEQMKKIKFNWKKPF